MISENVKSHLIEVPPAHYDSILDQSLKFYFVKEDKENPFNVGDFLSFLCICAGRPVDCIECNHKITYKMEIAKFLYFYTEHWKDVEDWCIVGFEVAPVDEIKEMIKRDNNISEEK